MGNTSLLLCFIRKVSLRLIFQCVVDELAQISQ